MPGNTVRTSGSSDAGSAPLQRQTVTTLALTAIRDRILAGEYREGTALRQDALAAELGVSRIPVREALRRLEAEGLVTLQAHVGAVVTTLSLEEIREIFELRALIEVDLLRRAVGRTTDADLKRAAAILDRYEGAFEREEIAEWGQLNYEFHAALYAPAKQPVTLGIVRNLQHQSDRYFRVLLSLQDNRLRTNDEHRAIVEAVREGNEEYAAALLRAHVLQAGRTLLKYLQERRTLDTGSAAKKKS